MLFLRLVKKIPFMSDNLLPLIIPSIAAPAIFYFMYSYMQSSLPLELVEAARMRVKNAQLVLLKPLTYMNLSGEAVRYWMQKESIAIENVLVIVDDIALPFGTIRLDLTKIIKRRYDGKWQ